MAHLTISLRHTMCHRHSDCETLVYKKAWFDRSIIITSANNRNIHTDKYCLQLILFACTSLQTIVSDALIAPKPILHIELVILSECSALFCNLPVMLQ